MALRAPLLCLLCFFLFPGVKGTLVAYASFDQPGVLTALCPAASYSVSSSGVTIQSSTPVPGLGGNYAAIDGTAGSGLSVNPTLLPFIGDTFFATGTTQFSVAAWVNLDGAALPMSSMIYGEMSLFGAATDNLPRLVIGEVRLGNATGCRTPRFYVGQQSKPGQDTLDDVFPNEVCTVNFKRQLPNVWHHVAGIFDGSALQVFLDGQALGFPVAFTNGTEYPFWDQDLRIGGGPTGNAPFRGLLDDVRIYDSALTAEDIAELFQQRSTLVTPAALNTVQPAPPSNIGLLKAGQQVNLTVQGVDAANRTGELSYFWADFTTSGCTLASFAAPNDASPGLTFFGLSPSIAIGGGVSNGELCLTNIYNYNVSGTPATLQKGPANLTTVYLNEFSDISVDVTGFPSPSFQWQVRVTRQVIYPNLTVGPQTVFVPIPDEIEPTLSIFNANGTFSRIPAGSRRASSPITVRCVFKNSLSGAVNWSEAVEVIPLDVFRPETGGDGDGDDTNVAAIVVPVVVGPILLCLLCLLILLVVVLVVLARRRGGEWKPDLSKPDYEALAYGKFLDSPPSASKKQVASLKKLEELLLDSDYLLTRLLCDNAKATEADGVAKVVTYLYAAHGEAVGLVQYFITKEVETSNKEGTLFRANSISSKMFTTYSRVIALEYVWRIFAYPVAELEHLAEVATGETSGMGGSQTTIMGPMAMEVDPSKMEEAADDQINTLELWLVAQKLFSGMVKEKGSVPSEVRQMLRHVQSEVASKFSEQAAHKAMGGFLFLRLLCPSLMAPQVYGLLKAPPNAVAQRQLILIAKVMQNLANDTLPGKKEGYMERLNEFITSNQDRLRSFYSDLIAHADDGPHPSLTVPENVKTNSLIQLHKFISANYDKLSAVIQQEDEGLAEELQEVMDSIGSIDAEEL